MSAQVSSVFRAQITGERVGLAWHRGKTDGTRLIKELNKTFPTSEMPPNILQAQLLYCIQAFQCEKKNCLVNPCQIISSARMQKKKIFKNFLCM